MIYDSTVAGALFARDGVAEPKKKHMYVTAANQ